MSKKHKKKNSEIELRVLEVIALWLTGIGTMLTGLAAIIQVLK